MSRGGWSEERGHSSSRSEWDDDRGDRRDSRRDDRHRNDRNDRRESSSRESSSRNSRGDDRESRSRGDRREDSSRSDYSRDGKKEDKEKEKRDNERKKREDEINMAERKRKSRWEPGVKTFIPGVPSFIPILLSNEPCEALMLRIRIEEITYKLLTNQLDIPKDERDRSPSPEPQYDVQGKRSNTREQRAREKLMKDRQRLVERCTELYPLFKPPPDYRPLQIKKTKKIFIPVEKHPDYNFIGLIIGPRGITQKQMEKETGAKIAIRGKGSVKDGKGRDIKQTGEDEELHVLVTADTEDQLKAAQIQIEKLLVPIEEGKNEHKRMQLRKLAEINGTLRDNNWQAPPKIHDIKVECSICGEVSHPTSDCPFKGQPGIKHKMDMEYEKFIAEVTGGAAADQAIAGQLAKADVEKSYEEFMASISAPNINTAPNPWETAAVDDQGYIPPNQINYYQQGYPPQGQGNPWDQQSIPPWQTKN